METNRNEMGFKSVKDWPGQAKQLKRKFPLLSDIDLKFEAGKEDNLVERLVIKLNKKRSHVLDLPIKGQSLRRDCWPITFCL